MGGQLQNRRFVGLLLCAALLLENSALAQEQCIRVFSAVHPEGIATIIADGHFLPFDSALKRYNTMNPRVRSAAIFRTEENGRVEYIALAGEGAPIYRGSNLLALADQLDAISSTTNSQSIYVSLAGFSPSKAYALETDLNIQWRRLDIKSNLVVRSSSQLTSPMELDLPPEFFQQVRKLEIGPASTVKEGGRTWHSIVVDFFVVINSKLHKISVTFLARTEGLANEALRLLTRRHAAVSHGAVSPAEIVAEVVDELRRKNPKLSEEQFRTQIRDQLGKSLFVQLPVRAGVSIHG